MKIHLRGDREIIESTPLNTVTPSIEEEAEDDVEVEEDETGLMNNQWKEQMADWEEDSPMEMKEE